MSVINDSDSTNEYEKTFTVLRTNCMIAKKRWKKFFKKLSHTSTTSEDAYDTSIEYTPLFILLSLRLESLILKDKEMYELVDELSVLLIKELQRELGERAVDDFIAMCSVKLTHQCKDKRFANLLEKSKLKHLLIQREKEIEEINIDNEFQKVWEELKKVVPLYHMIQYCRKVIKKHHLSERFF